jgi:hypothetical protein
MLQGDKRLTAVLSILPLKRYNSLIRLVETRDADFIFRLRTNQILSKYLHEIGGTVGDQERWISDYKLREAKGEEFYFINIDPETENAVGLNRIYNFNNSIFELGSWIYLPSADISKSIIGDIIVKEIAFENLGFKVCTFNVRKENKSVVRYHKMFPSDIVGEDEINLYFELTNKVFEINKNKYLEIFGYGKS